MIRIALLIWVIFLTHDGQSQPALHIHFVTHNEPNDNYQTPANYAIAKANLTTMAKIIDSNNLRWNLQTSDGLVLGALADQATTAGNIFRTLAQNPYKDNVEIDPRYKNMNGRNIADQWHLLDSLGAQPSFHLGGCIYATTNSSLQPIDWEQYRHPIIGNIYGNSWQCSLITGAGSYPPHTNDLNDFGVFKPDTATNFYHHNPAKNLWCLGVGCAPVLSDTGDEQQVFKLIKQQVDSIQNGLWPQNKFYVTRIMTNQRDFKPAFFTKLRTLIDSLKTIPAAQLKWTTIGETFSDFQSWQTTSGQDFSQWLCGETVTGLPSWPEVVTNIFPNPASSAITLQMADNLPHEVRWMTINGVILQQSVVAENATFDLSVFPAGLLLCSIDRHRPVKIVRTE
ncbi:MAG: hypothetical protein U0T84_14165 [Chitinophagales bacterium]